MYPNHPSPEEKPSRTLFTCLQLTLLSLSTLVLSLLLGIVVGYYQFQTPEWLMMPTATPTVTPPAQHDLLQAESHFAQGDLNAAVQAYDEVIRKDPTNDQALTRQSRLLVYTGDRGKAVAQSAQAVAVNPNNSENLAYYCRALDWEAKYEEAFEVCFCTIELYPDYAEGYAFLSEIYTDLGNVRAAKEYAQQAIDLNFQSMDAHFNMGYALEVQGRYDEAASAYDQAIELAPNIAQNYIAAGLMYHTMGQYRQYRDLQPYQMAIDRFKRAIKLRPFDPEGYARLGWTYYFDGQYSRAIDALQQGLGVDPTYSKGWGYLGTVYYTRRRFEDAIETFPKAIELAENEFLRRARLLEIYTEAPTASGPVRVPIMQGRLLWPADPREMTYRAKFDLISYVPSTEKDIEQNCAETIAQDIRAKSLIVEPEQPITFTQAFSRTEGTAVLDLQTGQLAIELKHLPQVDSSYELKIHFWPSRVDSLGLFDATADNVMQIDVQFDEKLTAPTEYYYQLGLSYAYLNRCSEAIPWLVKSLELQPAAWNPAWHGVKPNLCYTEDTPPTPIPTPTPVPTATRTPG